MDPAITHAISSAFDSHSGHLMGVVAIWLLNKGLKSAKDLVKAGSEVLEEFRQMKDSVIALNEKMGKVVEICQDHDKRIGHLEGVKS